MDSSFDDREKRFILAEMIKASRVNLEAMINFVKSCNISPDWLEMQIPHGRTVNQCRQVAVSMGIEAPQHTASQHQQHSYQQPEHQYPAQQPQHHQPYAEHQPSQHPGQHQPQLHHQTQQLVLSQQQQHTQQQMPLPPPFPTTKRKPSSDAVEHVQKRSAVASPETHAAPQPRNIQPRPPANGLPSVNSAPTATASAPYRVPKKRGRPSRADKVAQARAAGVTAHAFPFLAPATRPIAAAAEPGPSISTSPLTGSPRLHALSPKISDEAKSQSLESSPRLGQPQRPRPLNPKASSINPTTDEAPPAQHGVRSPKSPASANLPPSSRVAVSDLKTTTPAVVTTGV